MTKILDRKRPFGTIVGANDGSTFHQDGVCFAPDGREVGAPAEQVETVEQVDPATVETATEKTPAMPIAPTPAPAAPKEGAVTREDIEALHPSQIKKLMESNGIDVITGPGSKAKNIERILAG